MRSFQKDHTSSPAAGRSALPRGLQQWQRPLARRLELGLDRPWPVQLLDWLASLVQFDLGHSLVTGARVVDELKVQLGASVWLAAAAILLSLLIGPTIGVFSGLKPNGWTDRLGLAGSAASPR